MSSIRPYKQVLTFLMEIMEQSDFAEGYKMPSERMLAVKFKASRRSIRLAYETLIAQGLVVRIHGKGHFTTGNRTNSAKNDNLALKKIYFVVPFLKTQFTQDILNGVTDFCDEHAMDVSIKLSKCSVAKETHYINSVLTSDAKGIILFPIDNAPTGNELGKLSANRFPLAIIDRYLKNITSSFISTDNYNAMIEAVKFLHEKQHRNLLYLSPPASLATSVEERLNGYRDAVQTYYNGNVTSNVLTYAYFGYEEIFNGVVNFLKEHPETEIIITTGVHENTDAVIAAVNSLNLSIPKDIRLMTFDCDFSSTEIDLFRPYVIKQDAYQIGYKSAAALYNQIYGDLRTETIRLPVTIIDYSQE